MGDPPDIERRGLPPPQNKNETTKIHRFLRLFTLFDTTTVTTGSQTPCLFFFVHHSPIASLTLTAIYAVNTRA